MVLISLITPTGDRAVCMQRCLFYINRQTYIQNGGQVEWVISDDGKENYDLFPVNNLHIKFLKRVPGNNKPKSFTGNVINCLSNVTGKIILVIEDDDWYAPDYIDQCIKRLEGYEIIGEVKTVYYNVKRRCYRINGNRHRSSFCQTVFRDNLISKAKKYCEVNRRSAFVDARIWEHVRKNKVPYKLYNERRLCIGIKGMPGRRGIGIGHRPGRGYLPDPRFVMLSQFIGEKDSQYYQKVYS